MFSTAEAAQPDDQLQLAGGEVPLRGLRPHPAPQGRPRHLRLHRAANDLGRGREASILV